MNVPAKAIAFLLNILIPLTTFSQSGMLKGKITTHEGLPVEGALVELIGAQKIVASKEDGTFQINKVPAREDTIRISLAGKESITKVIRVQDNTTAVLNFELREQEKQLTEIIVTANASPNLKRTTIGKIPIKVMDLPQAVVTITGAEISNQQAQRLSDVVKNINGVYLGTARAGTQETFFARGYSFSSTNMFKNGSRVNTGAMPETSSLEKVEVLKGGAAILYGNVAPGGVLNMVTKKPQFDWGGTASFRTGSYGLVKPVIDVYGPLGKSVAFRLNGTYEMVNSYRKGVSSRKYYLNPSLLVKLGNKTELLLESDYLNHYFTPDFGIGSIDNTKIPDVPRGRFLGTSWQYNQVNQVTTSATLKQQINNNWEMKGIVSWQEFARDYFAVERIQANAQGDWARPLGRINMKERYLTAQVNLNGKWKTGKVEHLLLAGMDGDYYNTGTFNFDVQGKIYDTLNILDLSKYVLRADMPMAKKVSRVASEIFRTGIYVQDLLSLTSKVKLLAGMRWSVQSSPAPVTQFMNKDSVVSGMAQSDQALLPRIGIVFRAKSNISVFGSYSNSFMVNTGTDIFGNSLKPSILDQYETGIKTIFFGGKLTVNVTAYKIMNNNLAQTAQYDKNGNLNSDSKLKELSGQTVSNGIELDVTANPIKGLSVLAGYSFNDMHYTKTPDTKGSYVEGERLVTTPAHTANATTFYHITEGKLKGMTLGSSFFYTGARFGGWNNTKGQAQNYSRLIPVAGFTTLDVSAGYSYQQFSLLLKLSNLLDTYNYYVHENYSINPIPPRQFIGTFSYRF